MCSPLIVAVAKLGHTSRVYQTMRFPFQSDMSHTLLDKSQQGRVFKGVSWVCLLCSKFWTRNRPGDKMRDRYNLNLLPGMSEDGMEYGEFRGHSAARFYYQLTASVTVLVALLSLCVPS